MHRTLIAAALVICAPTAAAMQASPGLEIPIVDDASVLAVILEAEDRRVATAEFDTLAVHEQAHVRARAALALARVGDPTRVSQLGAMLEDSDPAVRALAAFALGRLDYHLLAASDAARNRAAELLLARVDDAEVVAVEAAWALGALGGSAAPVRARLVAGALPDTVLAALLHSWWRLDGADVAVAAGYAGHALGDVRFAAATALRRLGDPNAWPTLEQMLLDTSAEVRLAALRGLREAPSRAIEARLDDLLGDRDRRLVCAALEALQSAWASDGPVSEEAFEAVLRRSFDRALHVRRCALRALGAAERLAVATDRLLEALGEPEPAVRIEAMVALRGRSSGLAVEAVERLLAGADYEPGTLLAGRTEAEVDAIAALVVASERSSWVEQWLNAAEGPQLMALLQALVPVDGAAVYRVAATLPLQAPGVLGLLTTSHQAAPNALDDSTAADLREQLWRAYFDAPIQSPRRHAALRAFSELAEDIARRRAELVFADGDRAIREWAVARWRDATPLPDLSVLLAPHWTERTTVDYQALARDLVETQRTPLRVRIASARGEVVLALRPDWAPFTTMQFLRLARAGRFDGGSFYRVIAGFVSQGGPADEQDTLRLRNEDAPVEHARGVVAMALAGRDTGTEHFYITHAPQPHLRGAYPVFGTVIEGQRVVERIQPGDHMTVTVEGPE